MMLVRKAFGYQNLEIRIANGKLGDMVSRARVPVEIILKLSYIERQRLLIYTCLLIYLKMKIH